jgi:hypothetical protein
VREGVREGVRERQREKCENIFGISIMGGGGRGERERERERERWRWKRKKAIEQRLSSFFGWLEIHRQNKPQRNKRIL